MASELNPLILASRHGPLVLVGGLAAGLAIPQLAHVLRPLIPHLVIVLLFLSVLRMEPRSVLGSLGKLPRVAMVALALQLAMPVGVICLSYLGGWQNTPLALALTFMFAAPSIVGSPNICLMMGVSPQYAMRIMVAGTAVLPATVLPIFWLSPQLADPQAVLDTALRLLMAIALTTTVAILARRLFMRMPSPGQLQQLEGASAIALAVFVIGLMPAVTEVAFSDPARALLWLVVAVLANLGAQVATYRLAKHRTTQDVSTALGVIAGNRNIALFLVSLPADITAPIMVFIGCYQIPMYLTPLLMRRIYRQ